MSYGRTRTRTWSLGSGTRTPLNGSPVTIPWPTNVEQCTDVSGNPDGANPLSIEKSLYVRPGTVDRGKLGIYQYTLVDYPFSNQGFSFSHLGSFSGTIPSDTATITDTLARTNPSRPHVNVPLFLVELRDFPKLLRDRGEDYIDARGRNSTAEFNFGLAPMISDLLKMADFTAQVDRKLNHLRRLHSRKGLSRNTSRTPIFSENSSGTKPSTTFQSAYNAGVFGYVRWSHREKKWGACHWLCPAPFKGTDEQLAAEARRLVHGWDISPRSVVRTIWESLPWSWFIDYFLNVDDVLQASANGLGQIASMQCVMHTSETVQQQVITSVSSPSDTFAKPGSYRYITKTRTLAGVGLTATVPFLSAGQLVTLSSIAHSLAG